MDERAALRAEVEALQLKLHQLHATDVNTFRRSYATIAQHVEALKLEASRLEALVHEVEPDVFTPEFLAEEFGKAAVVGGAGWVLFKLVKSIQPLPVKARSWLGGGLVVATAVVISWRFASSSIGRFASAFFDHRRRKKSFLKEVAELQHRIDILQALTSSLPGVVSQPNLAALAPPEMSTAAERTQAAAGAAGGPGVARSGSGGSGNGGNGGREQFVVVDLPRVESGGFVLPSPVPSPPPAVLTAGLPPVPPSNSGVAPAVGLSAGLGSSSSSSTAGASSGAGVSAAAGPFAAPAQQKLAGLVGGAAAGPTAAGAAAAGPNKPAARLAAVHEGSSRTATMEAAGAVREQLNQQQQQQGGDAGGDEMQGERAGSAYEIPDSVMKAGWGGVQQQRPQQTWQPPPSLMSQMQPLQAAVAGQQGAGSWPSQQQQQQLQHQASPASRQWSSDLGDEGELVEQPSDPEEAAHSSSSRRTAGQLLAAGAAGLGTEQQKTGGSHGQASGLQRGSPASSSSDDAVLLERE